MAEIKFNNTSTARNSAEELISAANSYSSCMSTLEYMKQQIANNWDGSSADIASIQLELTNSINEYNNKIIPALQKLGNGITAFANATDKIASNTVQTGSGAQTGTVTTGGGSGSSSSSSSSSKSETDKRLDALEAENKKLQAEVKDANKSNWTKSNEEFASDFIADGKEYGRRVANDWGNVAYDFKNGEYVSGIVDTVTAVGGTVWNTAGLVVNEVANGADWLVDQVFGNDGLLGGIFDLF